MQSFGREAGVAICRVILRPLGDRAFITVRSARASAWERRLNGGKKRSTTRQKSVPYKCHADRIRKQIGGTHDET
jgi:hypothetical protein